MSEQLRLLDLKIKHVEKHARVANARSVQISRALVGGRVPT
jgi:hypothetical protein